MVGWAAPVGAAGRAEGEAVTAVGALCDAARDGAPALEGVDATDAAPPEGAAVVAVGAMSDEVVAECVAGLLGPAPVDAQPASEAMIAALAARVAVRLFIR